MAISHVGKPAERQLYADAGSRRVIGWDERTGRYVEGLWYHTLPDYGLHREKYVARVIADCFDRQRLTMGSGAYQSGRADGVVYFFGLGQPGFDEAVLFEDPRDAVGTGPNRLKGPFHASGIEGSREEMRRLAAALRRELRQRGLCEPATLLQDNEEWLGWPVWTALLVEGGRQVGWWPEALADRRADTEPVVKRGGRWITLRQVVEEDGYYAGGRPIWNEQARYNHPSNLEWRLKFEGLAEEIVSWTFERAWGEPFRAVFPGARFGNYGVAVSDNSDRPRRAYATSTGDWHALELGPVLVRSMGGDFSSPSIYMKRELETKVFRGRSVEEAHVERVREEVGAIMASAGERPVIPWIEVPGNGQPAMTERMFLLKVRGLLRLGVTEVVLWGDETKPGGFNFDQVLRLIDAAATWAAHPPPAGGD
ncbi:MAG: hypothetical protein FJ255_06645 [Phycisphaerae bacterium]|nr:hypothetical protein [Phycisphaerae bacterium]